MDNRTPVFYSTQIFGQYIIWGHNGHIGLGYTHHNKKFVPSTVSYEDGPINYCFSKHDSWESAVKHCGLVDVPEWKWEVPTGEKE